MKLPHYGMVNLVAGREVVPELIQEDFTPGTVEREVRVLLEDGPARQRMTEALAEVRGMLRGESWRMRPGFGTGRGETDGAHRAARAVLQRCGKARAERE